MSLQIDSEPGIFSSNLPDDKYSLMTYEKNVKSGATESNAKEFDQHESARLHTRVGGSETGRFNAR